MSSGSCPAPWLFSNLMSIIFICSTFATTLGREHDNKVISNSTDREGRERLAGRQRESALRRNLVSWLGPSPSKPRPAPHTHEGHREGTRDGGPPQQPEGTGTKGTACHQSADARASPRGKAPSSWHRHISQAPIPGSSRVQGDGLALLEVIHAHCWFY